MEHASGLREINSLISGQSIVLTPIIGHRQAYNATAMNLWAEIRNLIVSFQNIKLMDHKLWAISD